MTKRFSKGQLVTLLRDWDSKGTVRIDDLAVYSCGAKQMILVDAAGTKFQGRLFHEDYLGLQVLPRLSPEAAEAAALAMAAEVLAHERAHLARCLAISDTDAAGSPAMQHAYRAAIEKSIATLHEPRAVRA